jgi:hypothetical protein
MHSNCKDRLKRVRSGTLRKEGSRSTAMTIVNGQFAGKFLNPPQGTENLQRLNGCTDESV